MRRIALGVLAAVALATVGAPRVGNAFVADAYDPDEAPIQNTWFDTRLVSRGTDPADAFADAVRADREYVRGMRPHHAGALTMSEEYLRDPQARNPDLRRLAQAIIVNQAFEIGLLDDVARKLDEAPRVLDLGLVRLAMRPEGTEGLGQQWRFIRQPVPVLTGTGGEVSERDVRFAKAMMVHHGAALDMARAYNSNPAARNNFIGLLNVHIITDQAQEIALMRNVVAAYPGDADAVRVDPSDVHGMGGHMAMPGAEGHSGPSEGSGASPHAAGHSGAGHAHHMQ